MINDNASFYNSHFLVMFLNADLCFNIDNAFRLCLKDYVHFKMSEATSPAYCFWKVQNVIGFDEFIMA